MDKNGETYGIGILYGKSIGKNSEHIGEPHVFLDKHHDEKAFWWKNDTGPDENLAVTPRSSRQFLLTTTLKPSQKSMSYAGEASASRTQETFRQWIGWKENLQETCGFILTIGD